MLFKKVFLFSTNKTLHSWCAGELGAEYKVRLVSKESYRTVLKAGALPVCFIIDFDLKSEIELLAADRYLSETYHLPIIFIYSQKKVIPFQTRSVFSPAQFISVFSRTGALKKLFDYFPTVSNDCRPSHVSVTYRFDQPKQLLLEQSFEDDILSYDIFSGVSPVMKKFREQVMMAASSEDHVLILGESGSGKSYTAQFVHTHSLRRNHTFFPINVADLTPSLAESQLFGVEKGAYTDAKECDGLFSVAEGGTLFLDEIGEMTLSLQAKLLDVIENRRFRRLGSVMNRTFSARLIFATNADLKTLVATKQFRSDLFYRINVLCVRVPALKEHVEDIPLLAKRFSLERSKRLSSSAVAKLCAYDWPGNIRELHNLLNRACTFCKSKEIKPEDIAFYD